MADIRGKNADATVPDIATWGTGNVLETGEGTVKVDLDNKASLSQIAIVTRDSSQSLSDDTDVFINFDNTLKDTSGFHNSGSNNSRLTLPADGVYSVSASVEFTENSTGERRVAFRVNGETDLYGFLIVNATSGNNTRLTISAVLDLEEGDYVEVLVRQDSGEVLNIISNPDRNTPRFAVHSIDTA